MVVLGVDLRSSEHHESSSATISPQSLALDRIQSFKTDGDLLAIVNECKPQLVALGTPLSLPNGMCCLDQQCFYSGSALLPVLSDRHRTAGPRVDDLC